VLLTLAFLAASAILVTIYKRIKAVDVLGIFLLGVIINLGILLGLIALGGNL
jgi:4-hydroxybenzoate polyprenyltransferase